MATQRKKPIKTTRHALTHDAALERLHKALAEAIEEIQDENPTRAKTQQAQLAASFQLGRIKSGRVKSFVFSRQLPKELGCKGNSNLLVAKVCTFGEEKPMSLKVRLGGRPPKRIFEIQGSYTTLLSMLSLLICPDQDMAKIARHYRELAGE